MAGGVLGRDRPALFLDELDETVGGIEGELHTATLGEHVFVCKAEGKAASRRPSRTWRIGVAR